MICTFGDVTDVVEYSREEADGYRRIDLGIPKEKFVVVRGGAR